MTIEQDPDGIPIEEQKVGYAYEMPDQELGGDEYGDEEGYVDEREDMAYEEHTESPEDKMKAMIQEIIEIYNDSGQ